MNGVLLNSGACAGNKTKLNVSIVTKSTKRLTLKGPHQRSTQGMTTLSYLLCTDCLTLSKADLRTNTSWQFGNLGTLALECVFVKMQILATLKLIVKTNKPANQVDWFTKTLLAYSAPLGWLVQQLPKSQDLLSQELTRFTKGVAVRLPLLVVNKTKPVMPAQPIALTGNYTSNLFDTESVLDLTWINYIDLCYQPQLQGLITSHESEQQSFALRSLLGTLLKSGCSTKLNRSLGLAFSLIRHLVLSSSDPALLALYPQIKTQPSGIPSLLLSPIAVFYRVKYCQLNRKIRKIVKNKYRYQKRYEWIQPNQRPLFVLRLFKKCLSLRGELRLENRLAGLWVDHMSDPLNSVLVEMSQQHQQVAVSVLSQTTSK